MNKNLLRDSFLWGGVLWIIGYVLGIVFFMLVPPTIIGWVIMPFGILITLWVLFRKVKGGSFSHLLIVGIVWALLAIVLDYVFIVQLLHPIGGYYKLDVYLYYLLTFLLPLIVYPWKKSSP